MFNQATVYYLETKLPLFDPTKIVTMILQTLIIAPKAAVTITEVLGIR